MYHRIRSLRGAAVVAVAAVSLLAPGCAALSWQATQVEDCVTRHVKVGAPYTAAVDACRSIYQGRP